MPRMNDITRRMPAVFFGHGSPMNAITRNAWTEAWRQIGAQLPKPRAILAISAHWTTRGTAVTAMAQPRTIHDFGGFPRELYEVRYPAPGDAALAQRVQQLLAPLAVQADQDWGLDHGVWSVLVHAFPQADVPVVQLSMDATQPHAFHYELGKKLAPLRDEGVLIAGFGNIVHNLRAMRFHDATQPYDWAASFDTQVRQLIERREHAPLLRYEDMGDDARLSVPTPEHFQPLLYVLGAQQPGDVPRFAADGTDLASITMTSVLLEPLAH